MEKQVEKLEIINPKKNWVIAELKNLINEWGEWQKEVSEIKKHSYNRNTHTEVYADGEENMEKHLILQAKTLTFLNNNIKGHGFIKGFDGNHCDRTDLRLKYRVAHRLNELKALKESLKYAEVSYKNHTEKQKDNNPLELKPNFYGIGIDLRKVWFWIKKKFKRNT